ncbi:hypothetical protein FRC03_010574 [Tulasnella sp. 419]|nr:hypothetical protein FRC03_010574 [Tulasnella sp. 419]
MRKGSHTPFLLPPKGKRPASLPQLSAEDRDLNEGVRRRQGVPMIRTAHTPELAPTPMRYTFKPSIPHRPQKYRPKGVNAIPLPGPRDRRSSVHELGSPKDEELSDPISKTAMHTIDPQPVASPSPPPVKKRRRSSPEIFADSPASSFVSNEQTFQPDVASTSTSLAGPSNSNRSIESSTTPTALDTSFSTFILKSEPVSPPLSTLSANLSPDRGTEFIPIIPECQVENGGYREARSVWKRSVKRRMEREGKNVLKMIVRGDGMAVDWTRRSPTPNQEQGALQEYDESAEEAQVSELFPPVLHQEDHTRETPAFLRKTSESRELPLFDELQTSIPGSSRMGGNTHDSLPRTHARSIRPNSEAIPTIIGSPREDSVSEDPNQAKTPSGSREHAQKGRFQRVQVINPGRHPYADVKELARSFLMQCVGRTNFLSNKVHITSLRYFRLFDTNRLALWGAYTPNALLSYQISGALPGDSIDHTEDLPLFLNSPSCRNLANRDDIDLLSGKNSGLRCAPRAIIDLLIAIEPFGLCSPSNELGNRFIWDVIPLPGDSMTLIVSHGDMTHSRDHSKALSFHRSFIVQHNQGDTKDFWPIVILCDQLTIRNFSPAKLWTEEDRL